MKREFNGKSCVIPLGRLLSVTILALWAVGAASSMYAADSAPTGPIDLTAKWQVGKRYLQRMEMVQTQEISVPNLSQSIKQVVSQNQDIAFTALKELAGGGKELEMEIVSQKMEVKMGDQALMKFDSTADPKEDGNNPVAAAFRNILRIKVKFLTDAAGAIQKVENYKAFLDQATSKGSTEVQSMLKNMLSEENIKRMGLAAPGLPGKPVQVGDTWPSQVDLDLGSMGKISINMNSVFKGWEAKGKAQCALLEHSGSITNQPGKDKDSIKMTVENGHSSGRIWYDPSLGMVSEVVANQDMVMKMNAASQNATIRLAQQVTTRLVEVKDAPK